MTTGEAPPILRARPDEIDRSQCTARRHGSASAAHNHGCQCPDAAAAHYRQRKARRVGRSRHMFVPTVGLTRRIHALQALGWSYNSLGRKLGTHGREVWRWTTMTRVRLTTHTRVLDLYDDLREQTPPRGASASRPRAAATAAGWATPAQWEGSDVDDPDAISDLDAARPARLGPLVWEDVEWLMQTITADTQTDKDQRIAERLSESRGEPVAAEAVAACRRRALQARSRGQMSDQDIIDIRTRFLTEVRAGTLTRAELAAASGVSASHFIHILTGRARHHLELPDLLAGSPYRGPKRRRSSTAAVKSTTSPIPTEIRDADPRGVAARTEVAA